MYLSADETIVKARVSENVPSWKAYKLEVSPRALNVG